jgi:hypothetical protein
VTLISDIACPHCRRDRRFKNAKALHNHIRAVHTAADLDTFYPVAFSLTKTMVAKLDELGPNRSETMRTIVDGYFGGRQ